MSVQVENLEHSMVKLTIEAPAEAFEQAIRKAYDRKKKSLSVPGFRKGKVPFAMIEKMYGVEMFYEDAANIVIQETYPGACDETGLKITSRPKVDIEKIGKGDNFVYTAEVAVRPEVELGAYTGIEVSKADVLVTDADVEEALKKELDKNARLVEVSDRPVKEGDQIDLAFEGSIDGVPFDGGKADHYDLTVGSHSFIPGFEEQLVGAVIGEEKDVTVTFPEDYHAAELAGKEAVFKCLVHSIREKEYPEADDAFAQDVSEFETIAEYRQYLLDDLKTKKEQAAKTKKENEAIDKLIENSKMDIAPAMIESVMDNMEEDYARRLQSAGIPLDKFISYQGLTEETFREQFRPMAKKQIETRLVLEEVVKAENITVSDEEFDAEVEKMATQYGTEADKLKALIGEKQAEDMKLDIAVQKAVTFVTDKAVEAGEV